MKSLKVSLYDRFSSFGFEGAALNKIQKERKQKNEKSKKVKKVRWIGKGFRI